MLKRAVLAWVIFCPILLLSLGRQAPACTLWAVAGGEMGNQATLIAKNRDTSPEQEQELRFAAPPGGLRFLALQPAGDKPRDIAGVNEKGLVVVTAAASCIPEGERSRAYYREGFLDRILTSCATVQAVVQRQALFTSPAFYLVADRSQIALIEVGLNGQRSVKVTGQGSLCHTNHYLDESLAGANQLFFLSSHIRLIEIQHLLKSPGQPLTLQDFIRISEDRRDGPDYSIWRDGSSPRQTHTLATWIISLPRNDGDPPLLYLTLVNPGRPPATRWLRLSGIFWARGLRGN